MTTPASLSKCFTALTRRLLSAVNGDTTANASKMENTLTKTPPLKVDKESAFLNNSTTMSTANTKANPAKINVFVPDIPEKTVENIKFLH